MVQTLDSPARKSLLGGLALSIIILAFPFLSFVFRYMVTLVHEFGHAIFGWLFGYPSIPAFDFVYGGGITAHQNRKMIIVVLIYAFFAWLLVVCRKNQLLLIVLTGIILLYTLAAFTSIHQLIIIFMGHGAELVFAIIFLYRAMSGRSIMIPVERPLYAFLGIFIILIDLRFAYRLMTSKGYRMEYGQAKGGGHWMDFSRIAREFLHIELSGVAFLFLLLCLITPLVAYLIYRHKNTLNAWVEQILTLHQ